jgi:fatty acid desaturase
VAGWPSFFWEYSHLVVHHGHLLEAGDWTLPRRREDGSFESIYRYSFCHWPWRTAIHFWQEFRPGGTASRLGGRALRELAIFLALWTLPFWLDPVMAICLWVLPHFFANVVIKGPGMYVQHVGCESPGPLSRYRQATTSIDRFFNLTMFNIGYHIEHHAHPGVHWSELPLLHRNLRQELINEGSHVLPSGYYRWATVFLGRPTGVREAAEEFARAQAPGYGPHRGC